MKEVRMSWGGMGENCCWSAPRCKRTQWDKLRKRQM